MGEGARKEEGLREVKGRRFGEGVYRVVKD